jgi:hypothetical protein
MNKRIVISITVILALALGGGYALWQNQNGATDSQDKLSSNGSSQEEISQEETDPGRVREDQVVDNSSDNNNSSDNESSEPSNNDSSGNSEGPAPEKPNVTRAEYKKSDEEVRVAAIFNNQSEGTCVLRMAKEGEKTIKRTAEIIAAPTYYACDGFRIPVSEFPSSGKWSVTVTHKVGDAATVSEVKHVDIVK